MNTLSAQRISLTLAALAAFGLAGTAAQAQSFTPGSLVISVVGDINGGTSNSTLASTGNSLFVNDLSTTGALIGSSINTGLFDSGTATSDSQLTLSTNGALLTIAGYQSTGTTSITSSATINRGISEIGANGSVTTSFFSDGSFGGNNIRSAVTTNGSTVYLTGGTGGVRQTTFGSGTTTQDESATPNTRVVNIFNGIVYESTGSATGNAGAGIYSLGPVGFTAPVTPTAVALDASSSPYDFYFANATTLFVADDSAGLQKYTNSGSGFTLASTFTPAAGVFLRSLAGNGTDIFGVTTANSVVDFNVASGTFSTILTDTTANSVIRGVDFAPTPAAAVPEASTTLSFGLLLALGLGGLAVAKKRSVRA